MRKSNRANSGRERVLSTRGGTAIRFLRNPEVIRTLFLASVLSVVLGVQTGAMAAFCGGINGRTEPYYTSKIFCDDFDRYCTTPPADPNSSCGTDATMNLTGPTGTWRPMSFGNLNQCPGTNIHATNDDTRITSNPYGGRYPCQGDSHLGMQEVNLVSLIQTKFGSSYTAVNGGDVSYVWPPKDTNTAGNALNLIFTMNGGNCSSADNCNLHFGFDNAYMELGLDNEAGAPTDFVKVGRSQTETCNSCLGYCASLGIQNSGAQVSWPTICQQYNPWTNSPHCPPAMSGYRKAIAVGAVALLDNNPCHCDTPDTQVPENDHLSYYDGWKWRILKSGDGYTTAGDFRLGNKWTEVQVLVKATTVDIRMVSHAPLTGSPGTEEVSTAVGLPRLYTGPFNKLRAGFAHGCELSNSSYGCISNDTCYRTSDFQCNGAGFQDSKASNIVFDGVWLRGGYAGTSPTTGACCPPNNGTCQDVSSAACTALGGTFGGLGSSCSSTICCNTPWADADGDGDVDQDDFGKFQACYTGVVPPETGLAGFCACADRGTGSTPVRNGMVNSDDLTAFMNCFTGSNVPWTALLTPSCYNP